jgi:cytochrome c biogenesis protein
MAKKKERNWGIWLWELFKSFKLAIIILIILGILSIIALVLGEVLNTRFQNWDVYYAQKFGEGTFQFLKAIGVFNPFHSFIYQFFLILLAVNIVVCTFTRFKYYIHQTFVKSFRHTADEFRLVPIRDTFETKQSPDQIINKAQQILKKRFFRFYTSQMDGKTAVFATRGGLSRLGYVLIHLGLLILLLGGVITSKFGYSIYRWGGAGDVIDVPKASFQVRVDDFKVITNPRGEIKDYLAVLTVVEDGTDQFTRKVEVNHPLRYRGFNFYQSSYTMNARAITDAQLAVTVKNTADEQVLTVPFKKKVAVPHSPYAIQIVDYAADFRMENNRVFSASPQPRNPAVEVAVFKGDSLLYKEWSFLYFPDLHKKKDAPLTVALRSFHPAYMTGLEITTNPGALWILFGIAMMTLGIVLSFYLYHKRIWILLEPKDRRTLFVHMAGATTKGKRQFTQEMKTFFEELKS